MIWRIGQRSVDRGMLRRTQPTPNHWRIDEKYFTKGQPQANILSNARRGIRQELKERLRNQPHVTSLSK